MKPESADPSLRFDNPGFSNVVEDGRALSMFSHYTCPRCAEVIRFTKREFEDLAQARSSNLPASLALIIDRWGESNGVGERPFLDWLCPGCGLAVRAYTHPWAGGRHGDAGTDIVALVELEQDPSSAR